MDEEIERLVIGVRADTSGFTRDVAAMRGDLEGSLGEGAERAGSRIETALLRAVRSGKFGFDDLKRVALSALSEIAGAAVSGGVQAAGGGGLLSGLVKATAGLPGRATGGPVSRGAAYLVGERGPELFVPTASGRVIAPAASGGGRDVRVAITINGGGDAGPQALAKSGRQVARAVKAALMQAER